MSEHTDRLIDGLQRAVLARDRAAFADVCALDIHYEDPFSAGPLRSCEAIADHFSRIWVAAPKARIETSGSRLEDGRFISAPLRLHGKHTGGLAGLPATRRNFDVQVLLYCELDPKRERLWRIRAFFDAYDLAVQLGVLPPRGGAAEKALMVLRGFGLRARGAD